MTDLATTNDNQPLATTASAECSPALWRQLMSEKTWEQATMELAHFHRSELLTVAERLEAHAKGCGAKAVIAELMPLVTLYGVPDRSEKEWTMFWRFYIDTLGELPIEALRRGVAEYVERKDSEFFPKPGPLKAICAEHAGPVWKAVGRVRRALQIEPSAAEKYCRFN
jgi:hypothetical protein